MPYCNQCGRKFRGKGIYCAIHDPYYSTKYTYTSDSSAIRDYHGNMELIPTSSQIMTGAPSDQLAATASAFQALTEQHCINDMTLSTHPNGARSISISANKDRVQCPICENWFPDRQRLEVHSLQFRSGCEEHRMCFRMGEEHHHGTTYRHQRCFVRWCGSIYRKEDGWKGRVIEKHVRERHWG